MGAPTVCRTSLSVGRFLWGYMCNIWRFLRRNTDTRWLHQNFLTWVHLGVSVFTQYCEYSEYPFFFTVIIIWTPFWSKRKNKLFKIVFCFVSGEWWSRSLAGICIFTDRQQLLVQPARFSASAATAAVARRRSAGEDCLFTPFWRSKWAFLHCSADGSAAQSPKTPRRKSALSRSLSFPIHSAPSCNWCDRLKAATSVLSCFLQLQGNHFTPTLFTLSPQKL